MHADKGKTEAMEVSDKPEEPLPLITLKVLPLLKERQQQHGLRHSDYQRYHGYCSRRLKRLRETLHMPQGDKRHFKKKDVTLVDIDSEKADSRYLEIPLTMSERAWSYGMALKQDANTEPRKKFHSICRLQKAKEHAEYLFTLVSDSSRIDARTKLECEAYSHFINASFLFELQNWSDAVEDFKKAQSIYNQIGKALGDHPDASIYNEKATELLPSMRFCAYQTGDKLDVSQLSAEFKSAAIQALIAQKPKMSEVKFRKYTITVADEKLAGLLVRIDDVEQSNEKKVESYEELLAELRDGIQSVRDGLKTEKEQQSAKGKPSLLLSYLLYLRLRLTNARNELMLEEKTNPKDSIRLLDMIMHNYQEMLTIPGLDSDDEFQIEIDYLNLIIKARKCVYLAKFYMNNKKWGAAVELYGRGSAYLDKASKEIPLNSPNLNTVEKLREDIQEGTVDCQTLAVMNDKEYGLVTEFTNPDKQLIDRLEEFVYDESLGTKNPKLVQPFPCEMTPLPPKPIFFDLSGHQIHFPEEKLEAKVRGTSPKKTGKEGSTTGITGFVKGLWGWGNK